MRSKPFVSVIIPTYNREHLIQRAMESVLSQTFSDFELLVIDDCSKDDTASVVNHCDDPRVQYICNERNQGAAISRNRGAELAHGELLAFLDSDDEWHHQKLRVQIHFTEQCNLKKDWLCFSKAKILGMDEDIEVPNRPIKSGEHLSEYIFLDNQFIQTGTFMLPRGTFDQFQFNPSIELFQDVEFCLRAFQSNVQFLFLNKVLSYWYCDKRWDRIIVKHDGWNRAKWYETCENLLTEKAKKAFIKELILSRIRTIEEKEKIKNFLKHQLLSREFSCTEIIEIAKSFNTFIV
ncbi:MAG: glycosyltransferase family 2 protein [Candidatus Omnitrophota bacterium]|jgi:glycosyltransferase involved in cell wall biosynthesis|nr:MAG: glycosyltransferase family 2 protein [Candidatus Omnitrophota bacterium]